MDPSQPLPLSTESSPQPGFTGLLQPQQTASPSILASQLFFDTLKMITPVGESPNDEQLLVMALQSGLSQGLDHRRAIERLHGVNNHAANLWKDYYLEHMSHIDDMVNQLRPIKTAKKPVRFDLGPKVLTAPSEIRPKQSKRGRPASMGSSSVHRESSPNPWRRKRHSDLPIPPPPKVEPTPPTEVAKSIKGNLTVEEKKYFSKYISWALQVDPSLTKGDLIEKLAENVPRHTASIWNSYWARDPLADRLLVGARERTTRFHHDQGSTGNAEDEDVESDQETEEDSSHDSEEDQAAMRKHGRFFGAAEVRTMAKYIARHNPEEWASMTGRQRWYPFHHDHPHRSEVAYGLKYRSKEQEFLKLAQRYRRRALRQQYGTPSWANARGRKPLISS